MKSYMMTTHLFARLRQAFLSKGICCTILILSLIGWKISAQERPKMQVVRCSAIDQRTPIVNIYVDGSNNKWVATTKDLFLVQALDLASPQKLGVGEQSLLSLPDGNEAIQFSKDALTAIIGSDNHISAAFFDKKKEELWIGTEEAGAFQLKIKPALQLIAKYNSSNSKLKSNTIHTIFIDNTGEVWIGTEEGVMVGKGSRWSLEEKLVSFNRVTEQGGYVWLLGNGFIWKVNSRGDWIPVDIDPKKMERGAKDIAVDSLGRLWIASEIITMYDPELEEYQIFGPIQYYTSQYATCMVVDKDGAIWVGTEDKGLYLIEKASAITVNALVEKELGCDASKNDAALRVKVTGGKAPYTYAWTGGLNGENPKNVGPGEYSVTVTDSDGKTKTSKVKIENPRFTIQAAQDKIESAPGAGDGVASVTIVGNASDFTFKWDNGESGKTASKLTSGVHTVTVTDKKGCSATGEVTIGQKSAALNVDIAEVNAIKCAGDKNASVKIAVTGGKPPYKYEWNDAAIVGDQPKNLAPGNYQLKVTDAEGQSVPAFFSVKAPEALVATIQIQAPASTGNADGKALAEIKGGTGAYMYKWDNGETTANAVKLAPGKHSVTITDSNGCTTTAAADVLENVLPLALNINEVASLKCAGNQEGALKVAVNGGKAPYQYQWSDPKLTGEAPKGLAAGNYQVTVTDAAGNKNSANYTIKAPEELVVSIAVQVPASTGLADAKAIATAKGGSGNYAFKWTNGETTATANKLAAGKHVVTVTDVNGCTDTAVIIIKENILPLAISIQEKTSIKCAGTNEAALTTQVTGGKPPFQYQWSDAKVNGDAPSSLAAGTYQVTVTDALGTKSDASITIKAPEPISLSIQAQAPASTGNADGKAFAQVKGGSGNYTFKWDNGETTATAVKLAPGNHTLAIIDANGCTATATVQITENILPLTVSIQEKTGIKCAGTSEAALTTQVTGGKAPFQYQWSDPKLNGEAPANIAAGTYQVTVTDVTGTKSTASYTIKAPDAITVSIQPQAPASTGNADGKALAQVKGGSGNYTFKWDNGETTASAVKLAPGNHIVTVTDANGCSATATMEVSENILPLTVALVEKSKIRCADAKEGALQVQVSGGKPPYQYQWNQTGITGDQPSNLNAGNYIVTVTDALGTAKTATVAIAQPSALTAEVKDIKMATSNTVLDGKATVAAQGGTGNYTYQWSNGETAATATKLPPGNNAVTVTDANGCTATARFETSQRILAALSGTLRSGQTIRMEQLQFEADSSNINEASLPVINELYDFLKENEAVFIEIGGHTNSLPPDEVCNRLSTARAKSVVDYLIQKGIDERRLSYRGYGKRVPIADNNTPEGRQQNQRVEIKILRVGRTKEDGG